MRLLNQMLNLLVSGIFDCFSRRFDKVVFNLKLSNLVDSHLKAVTSRIKLGTCVTLQLSWVMTTVSAVLLKIPVNTLWYIWNFTNNNYVKFIHSKIPLQQKIDQIIHLNSKKKPIWDSYWFSFFFAYSQTICVATQWCRGLWRKFHVLLYFVFI